MDDIALRLIELIPSETSVLGIVILGVSAGVEYLFPPFPGDTLTLFGAFLITAKGWSFIAVFSAVLFGSAGGAMAAFAGGRWLHRRQMVSAKEPGRVRRQVDELVGKFRRHGEVLIVLNRFFPGLRTFFFVAAGMAGMRGRWVFVWALVSAALWNLLLIAIGSSIGSNFEELLAFLRQYSRLAWAFVGILLVTWLSVSIVKRVRRKKPD